MSDTLRLYLLSSICLVFCLGEPTWAADEIQVLKDLQYKPDAETEKEQQLCKLDLYLPAKPESCALIVWFHGGGLRGGDKTGEVALKVGERFAKEGIAVAAVNYRLLPEADSSEFLADAAAAVKFARSKIGEYGGSSERVFVAGHSSGGYLAAMVGLDKQYLAQQGMKLTDLAGVISVSGRLLSDGRSEINLRHCGVGNDAPIRNIRKDASPFLVLAGSQYLSAVAFAIAGSRDRPPAAIESPIFADHLRRIGHPDVTYLEVAGRNHVTIVNELTKPDDPVVEAVEQFIERLKP